MLSEYTENYTRQVQVFYILKMVKSVKYLMLNIFENHLTLSNIYKKYFPILND